jgi:hypothetical protein
VLQHLTLIYIKRATSSKKSRGRTRLTLIRIIPVLAEVETVLAEVEPELATLPLGVASAMPVEQRVCPKRERDGKNRARIRQNQAPPLFCPK